VDAAREIAADAKEALAEISQLNPPEVVVEAVIASQSPKPVVKPTVTWVLPTQATIYNPPGVLSCVLSTMCGALCGLGLSFLSGTSKLAAVVIGGSVGCLTRIVTHVLTDVATADDPDIRPISTKVGMLEIRDVTRQSAPMRCLEPALYRVSYSNTVLRELGVPAKETVVSASLCSVALNHFASVTVPQTESVVDFLSKIATVNVSNCPFEADGVAYNEFTDLYYSTAEYLVGFKQRRQNFYLAQNTIPESILLWLHRW